MAAKILCLDFDGVLHEYSSGWRGADVIPDPPVPGAMQFLVEAAQHFEVHVFSSRSNQDGGLKAMQRWIAHHLVGHVSESIYGGQPHQGGEPTMRAIYFVQHILKWPIEKPSAFVTIDDRAITFTGTWPPMTDLLAFKPWNKRS